MLRRIKVHNTVVLLTFWIYKPYQVNALLHTYFPPCNSVSAFLNKALHLIHNSGSKLLFHFWFFIKTPTAVGIRTLCVCMCVHMYKLMHIMSMLGVTLHPTFCDSVLTPKTRISLILLDSLISKPLPSSLTLKLQVHPAHAWVLHGWRGFKLRDVCLSGKHFNNQAIFPASGHSFS